MKRRHFLTKSISVVGGSILYSNCSFQEELVPEIELECLNVTRQTNMISNSFRIIMNNDGNDAMFFDPRSQDPYGFLSKRFKGLVDTYVDSIYYCTGTTHLFTHKTEVGEVMNLDYVKMIHNNGLDPLEIVSSFCRENGKSIFFSLRMNDTHDSTHDELFPDWKRKNPNLLMGSKKRDFKYGGKRWSAMNFTHTEVRDYIKDVIEEVIYNYDIDGIELDFFRHPVFFYEQMMGKNASIHNIEKMTGMIREISYAAKSENLKISIRIPDSLRYCYSIGLDINTWLCEDLVDIVVGSGYFHLEPWSNLAEIGKYYNKEVYVCLSASRLRYKNYSYLPIDTWRGDAYKAMLAGINGIYTFNITDTQFPLLTEFGNHDNFKKLSMNMIDVIGYEIDYWVNNGSKYLKI